MITPVGGDTSMTLLAIKAGVSQVQESPFFNKDFLPIKMASVPDEALEPLAPAILESYPTLVAREKRMLSLCKSAFSDEMRSTIGEEPIGLLLAGPEDLFPGRVDGIGNQFLPSLVQLLGINIDENISRKFCMGRSSVIHAIDFAFQYMQATGKARVLVGAVDTYRDYALLGALDAQNRLLASGVMDGFAPGEAAVFLLLTNEDGPSVTGKRRVQLYRPGFSEEKGHIYSADPYLGEGLHHAIRKAITHRNANGIQSLYSSMTGEGFWAKELGVAMTRNHASFDENVAIEHPADCIGDVGAATSAIALGMLSIAALGTHIVYGSSDGPWRSAICVDVI